MKAAMKAGHAGRTQLAVIRLARAAVQNAEIEKQRPLTDDEVREVLAREVRQRKDAAEEYRRLGRADRADTLEAEIGVLKAYLPEELGEPELRAIAAEVIAQTGAASPADLGKVMGPLMARVKGRADGRLVNAVVRELLS